LNDQQKESLIKKFGDESHSRMEERKIIISDLNNMTKTLIEQAEKKAITKNELVFHNSILKHTKKLQNHDDEKYRQARAPDYWP